MCVWETDAHGGNKAQNSYFYRIKVTVFIHLKGFHYRVCQFSDTDRLADRQAETGEDVPEFLFHTVQRFMSSKGAKIAMFTISR